MRLIKIRIRSQFYLGFGILIMLAVGVAVLVVKQLNEVKTQVVILNDAARQTAQIDEIVLRLELARRAVLRFATDADQPAADAAQRDLTKITEMLGQQARDASSIGQRQGFQSISNDVTVYADQLVRLLERQAKSAKVLAEGSDLEAKLTDGTAKLADATHVTSDPRVKEAVTVFEQAVARLRIDTQGFRVTKDPSWQATLRLDRESTAAALSTLEQSVSTATDPLVADVKATLSLLAQNVEEEVAVRREIKELYYQSMIPHIIAVQDDMKAKIDQIPELRTLHSVEADHNRLKMFDDAAKLQTAVAVVTLMINLTFAFIFSRGIVTPMVRTTHAMTSLANGNTSIDIPGCRNQNEIGDIARAVESSN